MTDKVNHPRHYTEFPLEVIDIIEIVLIKAYGEKAFEAYCFGNEIKYRMRAGLKGESADEDIRKANKYKEFREKSFDRTAKEFKQEVFDCLDKFLEENKHDLEQVGKQEDPATQLSRIWNLVKDVEDPDNEEWESDSDAMTDTEEADPEIVDKDTITDCMGNYFGRWCPNCHAEMEVVRPGKVQCSESCEWQEASGDVMSEQEKAEWIEKAKQGVVEPEDEKCIYCHGKGIRFNVELNIWERCLSCGGTGYVN